MTARGVSLLATSVLLWLLGRTLGVRELFVAAAAAAAFVGVAAVAVRLSTATVSARRVVARTRLLAGATADVSVHLRNDSRLPAPVLLVEDDCHHALRADGMRSQPRVVVAGLAPGRATSFEYSLYGRSRGRYTIGPLRVRLRDPFGLAERVRRYPLTDEVLVYPVVEELPGGITRGNHRGSEASDTRRLFSSGEEFYTLREYVTGDDLRQVHWPSTAHRAKLMVRQQELPWQPEGVLFCDTRAAAHHGGGPDSTLEKAISVTASLLWHLADRQYELRLATEADTRHPPPKPWNALLDRLAELEPSRVAGLAPALSSLRGAEAGGMFAAVVAPPPGDTPVARHPDVRALLACGRRFSGRLAVVVAPAADPGSRGAALAHLLRAADWKTVVLGPRDSLAARWPELAAVRRRSATGTRR